MKTCVHLWWLLAEFFLEKRNVSDKSCRENQNTRFIFNNLFPENRAFCDNVQKYGRIGRAKDDNIKWRKRFAFWTTKATNTHSIQGVPGGMCNTSGECSLC